MATADPKRAREIVEQLRGMLKGVRPLDVFERALPLARLGVGLAGGEASRETRAELNLFIGLLAGAAGHDRGDLDMLRESIAANTAALELFEDDPSSREYFKAHNNRALALVYLGQLGDDPAPMAEAIADLRQVLAELPRDAPEGRWANCAGSLGSAYWGLGVIEGNVRALRRAIACFRLAARAYERTGFPRDAHWADYNRGLASVMVGDLTGDPRDYDRAIAIFEIVLLATKREEDLREWATVCDAMALARANRGEAQGDPDAIAAAIDDCRMLHTAMPREEHPAWWAMVMVNFCEFTLRLATLRGDPAGMIAAAEASIDARDVASAESIPAYWMSLMQTAAKARLQLGVQTGDPAQIEQAIGLAGLTLDARQSGPRERANALSLRARALRWLSKLRPELATEAARRALRDLAEASKLADRRGAASLWCSIELARAQTLSAVGTRDTLQQSVESFSQVLDNLPTGGSGQRRGSALSGRGKARLQLYETSAEGDAADIATDFREARRYLREELDPAAAIEAAKGEASALLLLARWEEAATVAGSVLDRAATLIATEPAEHTRLGLAEALAGAGDLAAYALLKLGRIQQAIARHESGRAHRLRARFRLAEATIDQSQAADLARWRQRVDIARRALARAIEQDRSAAVVARLAGRLRREHSQFTDALAASGIETNPTQPEITSFRDALGERIAVVPVVTPVGGALLVLGGMSSGIEAQVIWIDRLRTRAIEELLSSASGDGWLAGYARFRRALEAGGGSASKEAVAEFQRALDRTLLACWSLVMETLDRHLHRARLAGGAEIVLVPDGRLSALPLHAAGSRTRAFLDHWAVSYAPSLSTFIACSKRADARAGGLPSLLAITDPGLDLGRISNPASSLFPPERVRELHGPAATRAAVIGALPAATYVSFFTHAEWNQEHPERSSLRLAGTDTLSAEDLASLDLDACRMAVLGACESGVPGLAVAADEFRGMPAALLEAGFPGALATLWPVFTHSTDRVIGDFFRHHLDEGLSPARALRLAQLDQRGNATALDLGAAAMGIRRGAAAPDSSRAAAHDLNLPVFWAAFAYIGA